MTVRILFVFITRLSKNHVLNKSVAKNVFSGKLSLVIILLFYGVSFGLIGGANLMSKNGQRSIEQQFREGNLYQIEMETSDLTKNDEFFSLEAQLYNKNQTDQNQKIADTKFVNPEIVYGTIKHPEDAGFAGFTNVAGELVAKDLLKDYDIPEKYKSSIGWTKKEWNDQLYNDLVEKTSAAGYAINDYLGGGTTFADAIIKYGFNDSVSNYGNALYLVKTLEQVPGVSYKVASYENITPRLSLSSNKDFEVSIINDIDFLTGKSLSETSDENNKFKHGNKEVNKTRYLNSSNDQKFYGESYFANDRNFNALNQEFNINIQEDYLKANGLKENDNINFSNATKFKVSNPIRFTEVTYPLMGTNFLVDEKEQGFLQMNLSDFLLFATNNTYDSTFKNSGFRTYVSLDNSKVNSINDWMGKNNKLIDLQIEFIKKLKSINKEEEEIKVDSHLFEQKINEFKENDLYSDFMDEIISSNFYFDSKGNFIDYAYYYGFTNLISEMGSFESIRALLGPIEISSTQNMLNVLTLIFMVIVLIVISMLINKRINDSGKQIGTLKAMGMSNKDISASYVIFPMVLIFMGFVVASLVSPIVMLLFTKLMSSYYYVSFMANPLSISYFVLLLFVPAILSIGLTNVISQIILRKPTLDLLSNKGKDSPNILVRAAGYVTPKWVPFQASYVGKGLLRAVGKSFMLFISIFLSTLLTAFAMSSTTMIEHQTNSALSYLNFDSFEYSPTSNYGQIDYQDMFKFNENSDEWEVAYEADLIGPNADAAKKDYEEMIKVVTPEVIDILEGVGSEQAFTKIYDGITEIVFKDLNNSLDRNILEVDKNLKISSKFVISKYQMEEVAFTQLSLQYLYNSLDFETTGKSFYEWEEWHSSTKPITYFKLKPFTENWLTSLTMNFVKSGKNFETLIKTAESRNSFTDIIDSLTDLINNLIHNIENKFAIVRNFESDLSFGTKYVNQFNQLFMSTSTVSQEGFAINSENYVETKKKENQDSSYKTDIYLNIMKDEQDFKNAYGRTSEISDELWKKMEPYKKAIDSKEALDAIPVIVTTQTLKKLDDSKDFKNLGNNTYEVAASYDTLSNFESPETYAYDSIKLKIKIKVVDTIFVGINFGMNTIDDFMQYYLDTHIDDMYYDSPENSFVKETNGDYKITYPDGFTKSISHEKDTPSSEVFYQSQSQGFNIINYKYAEGEKPHHLQKENTTTSLALSTSETTKLFDDGKKELTFKDYLDPSNPYTSKTKLMNGLPIKVDMLLAQAAKAYEMIIAMFMIISFFAIFMSTTIIIIAVKDVIDSSKREVSMLKAFGYSSLKSTMLIMMPYIFVALFAFVIALPMTFLGLGVIASILTSITGNIFTFTLTVSQWLVLTIYVVGLVLLLGLLGYISFRRTNALEAIKATDE